MLNNNDFAKLLTQPDQSGGKARYDLNQIKQWDKQNEAIKKKSFGSSSSSKHKSEDDEDGHAKGQKGEKESGGYKYVDRAEERRKQGGSLDPQQLEVIAASLDYEQSKFLGGDEEHTHLVKGLDYALLRKNREKGPLLASSSGQLSESVSSEKNMEMKRAPTKTMTALGQSIHKALFGANNTIPISTTLSDSGKAFNLASYASSSSSANTLNKGAVGLPNSTKKSVSMMIGHQGYDFDTDPTNANDLPTIVKRSKLVSR